MPLETNVEYVEERYEPRTGTMIQITKGTDGDVLVFMAFGAGVQELIGSGNNRRAALLMAKMNIERAYDGLVEIKKR
jgi:3'-phosphoadenosine 5'-phosphosulfate sulfotransferase